MVDRGEPHEPAAAAGFDASGKTRGFETLLAWVGQTHKLHADAAPVLPIGYFANVVPVGAGNGIAISTDGVGTKLLVAQAVGVYDTVGIDCVAMNVNDVVCVGATPVSIVDYIALEEPHGDLLEGLARGLYRGCELAGVNVPGGEVAEVREMIRGARPGYGFDLVGTCIGTVALDRVLAGAAVAAGDVVLGLASSGLHSNGFTLARRVLLDRAGLRYDAHVADLGTTLAEELLRPTRIYVREVLALLASGVEVRGLAHMSGGGLWNLVRTAAPVGYVIHTWPEVPPIFSLIQRLGPVPDAEAFSVFNMGIGFCVVVREDDAERARDLLAGLGATVHILGCATADRARTVRFPARGLCGRAGRFEPG
jgi:phosphoribosylformylglycinamidine cyclo-ligase